MLDLTRIASLSAQKAKLLLVNKKSRQREALQTQIAERKQRKLDERQQKLRIDRAILEGVKMRGLEEEERVNRRKQRKIKQFEDMRAEYEKAINKKKEGEGEGGMAVGWTEKGARKKGDRKQVDQENRCKSKCNFRYTAQKD
jgi:hypothetical protein